LFGLSDLKAGPRWAAAAGQWARSRAPVNKAAKDVAVILPAQRGEDHSQISISAYGLPLGFSMLRATL
jgi:hypothetical protein